MRITILNVLLLALLLVSCKKENPTKTTNPPTVISPNSFTLKKDGVLYTPGHVFSGIIDEDAIGIETYMVYGEPENNTYALSIRKSISPGTYVLEDGESENFSILHLQDSTNYFGWEQGTLTVLSNDTIEKIIHCTFEALLYNDDCEGNCPQITDGEMTVHY